MPEQERSERNWSKADRDGTFDLNPTDCEHCEEAIENFPVFIRDRKWYHRKCAEEGGIWNGVPGI